MENKFIVIGLILLSFILFNCKGKNQSMNNIYDGPEALKWLKENKNQFAFASNHFNSTNEAIEFVNLLYSSGAKEVKISGETIRDDKNTITMEGGPYADGLVVILPSDKSTANMILEICRKESDPGYDKPQIENNMIFLWWD